MVTELNICVSACTQYRSEFRTMAANPYRWHLFAHDEGVILLPAGDEVPGRHFPVVLDVQAMEEDLMVIKLVRAYRYNKPECWSK
jgi:hypothetical protein